MLARTLGLLYYFKHSQVVSAFQSSQLDFESAKSAFTSGIYKLKLQEAVHAYFELLLQPADSIEPTSDIDFGSVLKLKSS